MKRFFTWTCCCLLMAAWLACARSNGPERAGTLPAVDPETGRVMFPGRIYPERYNIYHARNEGHHAIVWKDGREAEKALIEADVSDVAVQQALISLGLDPGNNLTQATWSERHNPDSSEPDKHVKGPRLKVRMRWKAGDDTRELSLAEALREAGDDDVEIRFGGHAELIPQWQSGCIVCLFSCPGGRTSNAAYTIRDQAQERQTFYVDTELLPEDGTQVQVVLIRREASGANAP